jgi:hypothetical protein
VIPVLTGGGLVWVLVIGGFVAAYVRRRRRARAILARWEQEEAIEDARLARLEQAEAGDAVAPSMAAGVASRTSVKVEREGRWHTLH